MLLQKMSDVRASRKSPLHFDDSVIVFDLLQSGADLSALVKEAAITALKENLPMVSLLHQRDNIVNSSSPLINTVVKQSHFISAFSKITPSVIRSIAFFSTHV